jgi:hypothetical protein
LTFSEGFDWIYHRLAFDIPWSSYSADTLKVVHKFNCAVFPRLSSLASDETETLDEDRIHHSSNDHKANKLYGLWIFWQLMQDEPELQQRSRDGDGDDDDSGDADSHPHANGVNNNDNNAAISEKGPHTRVVSKDIALLCEQYIRDFLNWEHCHILRYAMDDSLEIFHHES